MGTLTKNCLHPWKTINVYGDGTVLPCCSTITGEYGNLKKDFLSLGDKSKINIFANDDYQKLRHSLLSGEIYDDCKNCRIVAEDDIPIDDLKAGVFRLLRDNGINPDEADLLTSYSMQDFIVSITNKCNLRCVYCPQSAPKSADSTNWGSSIEFYKANFEENDFLTLLDFLCRQGLKRLNFVGLGELTIYQNWKGLANTIFERYPNLHVAVVSNFSVPFDDDDVDTLLRFDQVSISCDTIDHELFRQIRVGGDLAVVLRNLEKLLAKKRMRPENKPIIIFNVTESDLMIDKLEDLARYAALNSIHLNFSNLYDSEGTVMDTTHCLKKISELPDTEMPRIWSILNSIPRRMKAQDPRTEIGQIGPFYNLVRQRAQSFTSDAFTANEDEIVYQIFAARHPKTDDVYLRDFYTAYDTSHRGIYMQLNRVYALDLGAICGTCSVRPILVRERADGNVVIGTSSPYKIDVRNVLTFDSYFQDGFYTHVLFEILDQGALMSAAAPGDASPLSIPAPPSEERAFVRETLLIQDVDVHIRKIADAGDPVVLWCAGARTKTLFDWSSLAKLNIKMIVDANAQMQGKDFYGFEVQPPSAAMEFDGKILICNATNPYPIEEFIRRSGYKASQISIL